jgi:23S rRNA pseudouridine2605 synthase
LISDTHGLYRPEIRRVFKGVCLIVHAGDVGGRPVLEALGGIAPTEAVYGNIDDPDDPALARERTLVVGGLTLHVSHGNELGRPTPERVAAAYDADVLVFGHTHQGLVVEADGPRGRQRLIVNPGAAGPRRFDIEPTVALLSVAGGRARAKLVALERAAQPRRMASPRGTVAIDRALSKLGVLSRRQAQDAIREGRVRVGGRIVRNPRVLVAPERADILVDGQPVRRPAWRTILFHKPRGVVTTRRDPERRRTVFDVLGDAGRGLVAVGRLDLATTGLLLLTTDTRLANWITDPSNAVIRRYAVTVRGRLEESDVARLTSGIGDGSSALHAEAITLTKTSSRESHAIVDLAEGRNREIRRLFEAVGHEVTRLKRVSLGGLDVTGLAPGDWRELTREEVAGAFPGAPEPR